LRIGQRFWDPAKLLPMTTHY